MVGALLLAVVSLLAETDPALMPAPVNTHPGEAYGPATRIFQGIPSLARVPGGRLWVTWYGGGPDEGPENYVMLSSSGDDGRTWSAPTVVIDPPGPVRTFDPVLWTDPQGKLWWFYAQSYRWWDGRAGVWALTTTEADTPNPSWSTPRRLFDGVMLNKPTVVKSGDWLMPVCVWAVEPPKNLLPDNRKYVPPEQLKWDPEKVGTHVYVSHDQGGTFALQGTAHFSNLLYAEHMIVERTDGSLWLWARTKTGIGESFSRDDGRTWTLGEESKIPHVASRFFVRRLRSGNLVLIKHNPPLDVAWLAPASIYNANQKRSHLTAYLSLDDGKTWRGGLLLDDRRWVSYPDGDQAPDGRIFIAYDYNRKTDKEICGAVFTEKDILAGKLVDPRSQLRLLISKATGQAIP